MAPHKSMTTFLTTVPSGPSRTTSDPMPTLRPVDLARLAGLSTQQTRNYEAAGILPPAARTASGYRTFSDVHRRALLTYRTLLQGYGHDTAHRVMPAAHTQNVPEALALVDAAHAALHEQRRSLRAASEALETIATQEPSAARRPGQAPVSSRPRWGNRRAGHDDLRAQGDLRIGEVSGLLGVRTSALRVWEAAGLLAPARERGTEYRHFSPPDVRDAG